jgi:hypothetical protein
MNIIIFVLTGVVALLFVGVAHGTLIFVPFFLFFGIWLVFLLLIKL